MQNKLSNIIAFDMGSSKISAIAAYVNKSGEIEINAQILQRCEGFKSGIVNSMELAENSIIAAIFNLEKECGKNIKEVVVSLSGRDTKSYYIKSEIKLTNQTISKQDIKKLINKAISEFSVEGKEIIHYFPIEFIIDSEQTVENPIGMHAKQLSCQLHIIAANSRMLLNITKCFSKCNVEVSEFMLSSYTSGLSVLTEEEKNLGCILVDIGSQVTSMGIFLDNKFVYSNYILNGSNDITLEIAKSFSISIKTAEKLKILYANAHPALMPKNILINIEDIEPENEYHSNLAINSTDISNIACKTLTAILAEVKKHCQTISMDHLLARRVIITGGGSQLSGIKTLAEEIFEKQIRIAKPTTLTGQSEHYDPYMCSTSIGMVKSKSLKYQKNSFKPIDEDHSWFKRTFLWIKENI